MAFKLALLAAVCIAQGFAFQPLAAFRGNNGCKNPALEIPYVFEETMHEMDEVRESVSMAAMDAYAKGNNFEVIMACFDEQKENYVKLGERVSEMIASASQELNEILEDKAQKYAKLMEVPLRNIAVVMRTVPEKVYDFIKNKEFIKAVKAMKEGRKIVEENARIIGNVMKDMITEVPEVADRAEELGREIREEARKECDVINQAFLKCVKEGGPKKLTAFEENSF